jgi:hypothetical protein
MPPRHWDHHCTLCRYPHDAAVSVGDLPIRLTDLQLLHEVKRTLRRYGECEAPHRRQRARMAHVIYEEYYKKIFCGTSNTAG